MMSLKTFALRSCTQPIRFAETGAWDKYQLWRTWLLIIVIVALLFSITLSVAPFLHMDELLTVELGRVMLHPHTDWSIAWIGDRGQPAFFMFYLGPVLQESSYQLLGQYGPRILALIGALVAATIVVKWLLNCGTSGKLAILLGLVFLLDPLFVQAYTLGRIDGWTIALSMAACSLLAGAKDVQPFGRLLKIRLVLAGAFTAAAFFIWPSAVFLFPLIGLALSRIRITAKENGASWKIALMPAAIFGLGSLITGFLVLLPVAYPLYTQLANIVEGMKINSTAGPSFGEQSGFLRRIAPFIELLRVLKFTPVLALVACVGLVWTRNTGLILALLAAITLMLCTVVYIHRVLYLVPYFIAATAAVFQDRNRTNRKPATRAMMTGMIAMLLICPVVFSLSARLVLGLKERADGNRVVLSQTVQAMLGAQPHNVLLLNTYEFYYIGRSLGWKTYAPYISMGDSLPSKELWRMLQQVDCAIILNWKMTEQLARQLNNEGFHDKGLFSPYKQPYETNDGVVSNMERLRSLYRIVPQPYGPYRLFVRESGKEMTIAVN